MPSIRQLKLQQNYTSNPCNGKRSSSNKQLSLLTRCALPLRNLKASTSIRRWRKGKHNSRRTVLGLSNTGVESSNSDPEMDICTSISVNITTILYGVISQKRLIFVATVVRTKNPSWLTDFLQIRHEHNATSDHPTSVSVTVRTWLACEFVKCLLRFTKGSFKLYIIIESLILDDEYSSKTLLSAYQLHDVTIHKSVVLVLMIVKPQISEGKDTEIVWTQLTATSF